VFRVVVIEVFSVGITALEEQPDKVEDITALNETFRVPCWWYHSFID